MAHPQIPEDITRVTESELRADLTTFVDRASSEAVVEWVSLIKPIVVDMMIQRICIGHTSL